MATAYDSVYNGAYALALLRTGDEDYAKHEAFTAAERYSTMAPEDYDDYDLYDYNYDDE